MNPLPLSRVPSRAEEIANSVSHGLGAALAIVALVTLVVAASQQGDAFRIVSVSVHGGSLVLLLLASTLYHASWGLRVRRVFQVLDHAGIHLLIAGTYTPFTLVTLRGPWGWTLFGLVWGFAICGIVFESLYLNRFPRLSTLAYLATGWVGAIAAWPLLHALPLPGMGLLVAGGLAYTAGVYFFARDHAYDHLIWHFFVLAGAAFHVWAVALFVL